MNFPKILRLAGLGLMFGFAANSAQAAQIIVNGGFETGQLSPWFNARNFAANPENPDWSVTNSTASSGAFSATAGDNYELKQSFAPVATASITDISFDALVPAEDMAFDLFYQNGDDQEFSVSPGTSWGHFDVLADLNLAEGALTGISFFGDTGSASFLDNVSITANIVTPPTGVPEPWTLSLFGIGLAGAGLFRRRKAA